MSTRRTPLFAVSRYLRFVCPGRNPLSRTSDHIEGSVVAILVCAVLLAVPVAASIGTVVYDSASRHEEARRAATYETAATVGMPADSSNGAPTRAPATHTELIGTAAMAALLAFGAMAIGAAGLYVLIRRALDRGRLAAWTTEWEQVGPRWTGNSAPDEVS